MKNGNSSEIKTNVMRVLEQKKVPYVSHVLENAEGLTGVQVAERLSEDPAKSFKTLVTTGASREHYVFIIPVAAELELKRAAKCVGEKSIVMLPQKELLPLTGYIHGGCSPIGMKKYFRTVLHESALTHETICVSGGKVGVQVELKPTDLMKVVRIETADVADFEN